MHEVKRLLVTGASGFVGTWTLRHLRQARPELELWATGDTPECPGVPPERYLRVDLRDRAAVGRLVLTCHPDAAIHLAGLTRRAPLADHLSVNVVGTDHLYSAILELPHGPRVRVVQAGTAAAYGCVRPDELPIAETGPFRPLTGYALSKLLQDYYAQSMWLTAGLQVVRARIFNLMGPGQPDSLVPGTFVSQLRKLGPEGGRLNVGRLTSRRDFVDVRDVAVALDRLLFHGTPGQAYNIGSGRDVSIEEVLQELLSITGIRNVHIHREQDRVTRYDVPRVVADVRRVAEHTGWAARIPLTDSLADMWEAAQPPDPHAYRKDSP